jgi:hypothetical protein
MASHELTHDVRQWSAFVPHNMGHLRVLVLLLVTGECLYLGPQEWSLLLFHGLSKMVLATYDTPSTHQEVKEQTYLSHIDFFKMKTFNS